jgi:hypothetical protein
VSAHPFTEATLAVVARKLDNAIALLEEYADTLEGVQDPQMRFSRGYRELLQMRGVLQAAQQLEQMTADVERADTERPRHLSVVK